MGLAPLPECFGDDLGQDITPAIRPFSMNAAFFAAQRNAGGSLETGDACQGHSS